MTMISRDQLKNLILPTFCNIQLMNKLCYKLFRSIFDSYLIDFLKQSLHGITYFVCNGIRLLIFARCCGQVLFNYFQFQGFEALTSFCLQFISVIVRFVIGTTPYSNRIQINTDQKNLYIWTLFTQRFTHPLAQF